jgi:hypothetical protein
MNVDRELIRLRALKSSVIGFLRVFDTYDEEEICAYANILYNAIEGLETAPTSELSENLPCSSSSARSQELNEETLKEALVDMRLALNQEEGQMMNENELIALERVAVRAREILGELDHIAAQNPLAPKLAFMPELRQELEALAELRLATEKEIIMEQVRAYAMDSSMDSEATLHILAGSIHQALKEAGYL